MTDLRSAAFRRALLGASSIAATALAAGTVQAQTAASDPGVTATAKPGTSAGAVPPAAGMKPEAVPQIVIRDNIPISGAPPAGALDTGVTGIGQMVINNGGGGVGLCTGTLINPRMVIFAAHCVNTRPATAYGSNQGGVAIGFGFNADNLPGTRSFILAGPNQFRTNTAVNFFNAEQIMYDERSLLLGASQNFIQADVAIAALDTPASRIPTWAMMFSPLPTPGSISTSQGTGYRVDLVGYGANGNGTLGAVGAIDFRRRAAENMLGALASFDDVNGFLFGSASGTGRPQNLYWVDFDDPRRGGAGVSPFDFNLFRDNALTREGSTAGGDSGGPLILRNTFDRAVILGVLSGGTRYFGGQPFSGYGTGSFYQPLYLFWDYIAANNPYRYVSNVAGDRNWTDPANWVTTLDPAYQVLGANGQLANGVPTNPGAGITGTTPKFGEVCFQQGASNQCRNLATGQPRNNVPNGASVSSNLGSAVIDDTLTANVGTAEVGREAVADGAGSSKVGTSEVTREAMLAEGAKSGIGTGEVTREAMASSGGDPVVTTADAGTAAVGTQALPAATLANGLPGATNFVPNNTDGVRATGVRARYFDVTLAAAGTTTLDTAVTIDRFAIRGASSGLNVTSTGSLTSLIDITQTAGRANVNGTLRTNGDYSLLGGLLSGNGTVITPFLTSVTGTIAPGGLGTIGTLTIGGNVILASGSTLLIDLGNAGASDRLNVTAGAGQPGSINLGGRLVVGRVTGTTPRFNDQFTFITSAGPRTGTFGSVSDLSAILFPVLTYGPNGVSGRLDARSYTTVINPNSRVQSAFARLLDLNRANYGQLSDLFGTLDLATPAEIQSAFESLAPRTLATTSGVGRMGTESMARFYRERMAFVRSGEADGRLTMTGNPIRLAALQDGDGSMSDASAQSGGSTDVALPSGMSGFIAGGFLDGRTRSLDGGRENLDGWFAAAGLEMQALGNGIVGAAVHYLRADGNPNATQSAEGELFQGTVYGTYQSPTGFEANAQVSAGTFSTRERRSFTIAGSTTDDRSKDSDLALTAEAGIGHRIGSGVGDRWLTLTPGASLRYTRIDSGGSQTQDGPLADVVVTGDDYESVQGRLGFDIGGVANREGAASVRPRVSFNYVHEFKDQANTALIGFAATPSVTVPLALGGRDRNWAELGVGFRIGGERISVDLSADTTLERRDLRNRTYRAALNVAF